MLQATRPEEKAPPPSPTELRLMQLLRPLGAEMYAQQLVQALAAGFKPDTVYQFLRRACRKGLLHTRIDPDAHHNGPRRPLYSLTEAGRKALPPEEEQPAAAQPPPAERETLNASAEA
jgi:DNA-binding PadR family transcriptional regulator